MLIYYFGMRKNLAFKEVVRRNSFKTYIWDVFFILSLIVVIYILSNNIRIIIGHKKKLGVSTVSVVLVFILCFSALFGLSYSNIVLKLLISMILLLISVSFFSDRKKSGKKINYTHHCIRLLIHLLMIGCLFLWF